MRERDKLKIEMKGLEKVLESQSGQRLKDSSLVKEKQVRPQLALSEANKNAVEAAESGADGALWLGVVAATFTVISMGSSFYYLAMVNAL